MKTIKNKILRPFLILIIVIPLVTLIAFNLAMRIYVNNSARQALKNTIIATNSVVKKELSGTLYDISNEDVDKAFSNIYLALRATKSSTDTEILLFNKQAEQIYPKTTAGTFVDDPLSKKISEKLSSINNSDIYTINVNGKSYVMTAYKLTKLPIEQVPYVVFISSLNTASGLISIVNIFLIAIMLIGIGVGIFISNKVSSKISKSVRYLIKITKNIGEGDFSKSSDNTEITELSMLHQSINTMSLQLESYDRAQKSFLQNASHELRTPLMSIQGYAEAIVNDVIPDTKHAAEIISNESKRLNTLVNELLTLSRIDNQTYTREVDKLNLCDMLKEYIQRLEGFALKEGKELVVEIPECEVIILADDTLLSQAIINIASNCIRYCTSKVIISLYIKGEHAIIEISDDGEGIDDNDLPHIFERFYKGKGGNTGLGLAIAKTAVEFMHGEVTACNTNSGAKFEIKFLIV